MLGYCTDLNLTGHADEFPVFGQPQPMLTQAAHSVKRRVTELRRVCRNAFVNRIGLINGKLAVNQIPDVINFSVEMGNDAQAHEVSDFLEISKVPSWSC